MDIELVVLDCLFYFFYFICMRPERRTAGSEWTTHSLNCGIAERADRPDADEFKDDDANKLRTKWTQATWWNLHYKTEQVITDWTFTPHQSN